MTITDVLRNITDLFEQSPDDDARAAHASVIRAHTFAVLSRLKYPAHEIAWDRPGMSVVGAYVPPKEPMTDIGAVRSVNGLTTFSMKPKMLREALANVPAGEVIEITYIGWSSSMRAGKVFAVVRHGMVQR